MAYKERADILYRRRYPHVRNLRGGFLGDRFSLRAYSPETAGHKYFHVVERGKGMDFLRVNCNDYQERAAKVPFLI